MEQLQIQINSMEDVKKEIDNAQRKACTSVVEIGYILRKADDAEIFRQQGYSSIFEFAKAEYGWERSQTSRFMAINREYSKDGYSTVLQERYEGYGQAKLAEMLTLPEQIREEIEPDMKREEIREIKRDFKAAEEENTFNQFSNAFAPAHEENLLRKHIMKLFSEKEFAERLDKLWPLMKKYEESEECNTQDVLMAVSGNGMGMKRVGEAMFFFKKDDIKVFEGQKKRSYSYEALIKALLSIDSRILANDLEGWYRYAFGKARIEKPIEEEKIHTEHQKNIEQKKEVIQAAVKKPEKNESPLMDKPLEGQKKVDEFAEKMPIKYEKASEPVTVNQIVEEKEETKTEENDESPLMETVIPDTIDGVCQFCTGNKKIESNDGSFTINLTSVGTGRIEHGQSFAVVEFDYCPKCGKKLGD